MTDIHDIKNLLYFIPYLREETWYMLGIGIAVYVIYIAYLIAFERYYKAQQETVPDTAPIKESFISAVNNLRIEDARFFEKLSFIVRSHLEDSNQVPLATKKTHQDIVRESISRDWKKILEICTYHEYAPEQASEEDKIQMLQRLRGVL